MRVRKLLVAISLILAASGCGPESSLNPLFEKKDVVFDDALVGTWITSAATRGNVDEGLTYTFKKLGDNAYEVIFPGDEEGSSYKSQVHLARLGKFLFLDAYPDKSDSDEEKQNKTPQPFPQIGVHVFGRIWIEKDLLRIALLDEEWVKNMAEKKKLTLGYASTRNETVLTASTDELQKLALQYAEDTKAFSWDIGLCRAGQFQASDCSIALLKQKLATNDPEAWDSLGQNYSKMGRDDEALAAFYKAAQIDPSGGNDFHNYHYNIGRTLLKKLQYEQARKEFLEAHRLRPTDSLPDRQIGFSYFVEGKFQEAVRAFQTDPWDVSCRAEGDCPARGEVSSHDNNLTILLTLALRHVGRQEEAKKELDAYTRQEEVFAKYHKHPEWEALLLSYEAGRTTESALIGKAETSEQKSEAYFYVGYEYLLNGDRDKAREYFRKTPKVVDSDEYMTARARLAQLGPK
jgi:tetratricopeptide (TPR) repeat protein